jgi:putative transposase
MLFALLYLFFRRLAGLAVGSGSSDQSKDAEILVLRHQLKVLHRQVGRPRLRRRDRVLLAALSRALPRPSWSSFAVTPQSLLRWHRELVARKWTYRRRPSGGRPALGEDICELILRVADENPRWGYVRIHVRKAMFWRPTGAPPILGLRHRLLEQRTAYSKSTDWLTQTLLG